MADPIVWYDIIIIAGATQGAFLAIILFMLKKGNRGVNVFLCLLLLAFAGSILHVELAGLFQPDRLSPSTIGDPLQFLFGPLFYCYVRGLTDPSFRFSRKSLGHGAPAAASIGLFAFSADIARLFGGDFKPLALLVWLAAAVQMLAYLAAAARRLKRYGRRIRDEYSNIDAINLTWLHFLVLFMSVYYACYILLVPIIIHFPAPYAHFNKLVVLLQSLLIYAIGYKGLTQPAPFTRAPEATSGGPAEGKYLKSSIDGGRLEEDYRRLQRLMETKKPYTNIDLSLSDLAAELRLTNHHLSQVINKRTGGNFYDYINAYRVQEVKRLLSDRSATARFTILGLAHDAGFSSKATFNRLFKKSTGMTPSAFVRSRS